jgi:hypothetical protein
MDHTAIDAGHYRLSIGTISLTSTDDLYQLAPSFRSSGERPESTLPYRPSRPGEWRLTTHCGHCQEGSRS